jgi:hypothetical protein
VLLNATPDQTFYPDNRHGEIPGFATSQVFLHMAAFIVYLGRIGVLGLKKSPHKINFGRSKQLQF